MKDYIDGIGRRRVWVELHDGHRTSLGTYANTVEGMKQAQDDARRYVMARGGGAVVKRVSYEKEGR